MMFFFFFFFFNDTATTEIYTLSLHDALPIYRSPSASWRRLMATESSEGRMRRDSRSEEHTSELQSRLHLVCRLLLEKKKKTKTVNLRTRYQTTHTSSTASLTTAIYPTLVHEP